MNEKIKEIAKQIVAIVGDSKVSEFEDNFESHVIMDMYGASKRLLKGEEGLRNGLRCELREATERMKKECEAEIKKAASKKPAAKKAPAKKPAEVKKAPEKK